MPPFVRTLLQAITGLAVFAVIWLIAAAAPFRLGAFVYRGSGFEPVTLMVGADWVTSSLNVRN